MGDTMQMETQWLFSPGELGQTPSIKAGMSIQNERSLRQKSILFILELGRYLSCNHLVISSASIMFQRFMTCQAFQNHDRFIICATCIFLAGKVEEQPKRLKDVVDVFLLIRSKVPNKFVESELKIVQDKILVAERILLQTLGFDLQIDHPYGHCMYLLKSQKPAFTTEAARNETSEETRRELNEEGRKDVKRLAMNFLTDSFRGVLCLEFSAEVIATSVTFLAVLSLGLPSPTAGNRGGVFRRGHGDVKTTTWMELFLSASKGNVSELDLKTCCSRVIEVYEDKVIAITGSTAEDDAAVKENKLREKLREECKHHEAWLTLPVATLEAEVIPPVVATVVPPPPPSLSGRAPPPPPPPRRSLGGNVPKPPNRGAPPPPPPRPAQRPVGAVAPPRPSLAAHVSAPFVGAPPTPDTLPPPTPDYLPPPTPDNMPPPTPEQFPPPTPVDLPPPQMDVGNLSQGNGLPALDPEDGDERAKKRRAEDREYSGNVTSTNGGNGVSSNGNSKDINNVSLDNVSGQVINGRNGDGSSPPKKYKM